MEKFMHSFQIGLRVAYHMYGVSILKASKLAGAALPD